MPYCPHPSFELADPDGPIWRYMDVAKLLSILVNKSLFFPSGRTLTRFDKFEGQPTYAEVDVMISAPTPSPNIYVDLHSFQALSNADQKLQMAFVEQACFFSCWHQNDSESDAMWKIYSNGSTGVAIRSTVGQLQKAFDATDKQIFLGKIRYYTDPDKTPPDTKLYVWRFMRKKWRLRMKWNCGQRS